MPSGNDLTVLKQLLDAEWQKILLGMLFVALPGLLALALQLARNRHDQQQSQSTQTQEEIRTEADAEKRRDNMVESLIELGRTAMTSSDNLASKVDRLTDALAKDHDLEEQRIGSHERTATNQAGAIREQTSIVASNTLSIGALEKSVDAVNPHTDKAMEAGVNAVSAKIDDAIGKTLKEIAEKLGPVVQQLDGQTRAIKNLEGSIGDLKRAVDETVSMLPSELKDFKEKFSSLKESVEKTFSQITETDQSVQDMLGKVRQASEQINTLHKDEQVNDVGLVAPTVAPEASVQ
jgi:chromosome segregation ATPase